MRDESFRTALLVSGLRWRAGSSLAMFAVAVFGIAISAFGPIYLHSADQAILNGVLRGAPAANTGITLEAASGNGNATQLMDAATQVPEPLAGKRLFGAPISTSDAGITVVRGEQPYGSGLVSRTGVCRHLAIVSGHCPNAANEVVMSVRSARLLGLSLGDDLHSSFNESTRRASLRIIGLYDPTDPSDPFWWGNNPFGFGFGPPQKPTLDDVFTTSSTLNEVAPARLISHLLQMPYQSSDLPVDSSSVVSSAIDTYRATQLRRDDVLVSSQLPQLVSEAGGDAQTTRTIVAAIEVQLVLLALFVLYFVSNRTTQEREPDVRLAELRGFRPTSTASVALTEPLAIVLAAVPVGVLVAWAVALAASSRLFGNGVGAEVPFVALGAAVVTGTMGVFATALGSRRLLSYSTGTPAIESATGTSDHSPWRFVGDAAVVAVAIAAFVELAVAGVSATGNGGHTDPLSAFAPGFLALALGVLAARLLPQVARSTLGRTRYSKHVGWALATRRVARRRGHAPQIIMLSLAVALIVFGASGWAVAARNQNVRSEFGVGAAKVLTVAVRPGVDFLPAVRAADPTRRFAMAVVVDSSTDGTTLAVDSSRMRNVISWPKGLGSGGATGLPDLLVPRDLAPAVAISGTAVRVAVDTNADIQPPPELSLDLYDEGYQSPQQVALGNLYAGAEVLQGSLIGLCPSGCRLVDLAVTWSPQITATIPSGSIRMTVSSISQRTIHGTWDPVRASLSDASRWTDPSGGARMTSGPRGLSAAVSLDPYGESVTIAPADVPGHLPIVTTPTSSIGSSPDGTLSFVGLDGSTLDGRAVGQVPALPGVGDDAVLVDLGLADRLLSGPFSSTTTEVWLAPNAPRSIVTRLARSGISIVGVDSAANDARSLQDDAIGLAYKLFLVSAIGAGVLAVGGTGFAIASSARRRSSELAAMKIVGVSSQALRRSIEIEYFLALAVGLLIGAASGALAAAIALKSLPEALGSIPGPPLELNLPGLTICVALSAVVVVLFVTVVLGSSAVVRAASVETLAGSQA